MNKEELTTKVHELFHLAAKVTNETLADPEAIPEHAGELLLKVHDIEFDDPGIDSIMDALKKSSLMIAALSAYWILNYTRGDLKGCYMSSERLETLLKEIEPVAEAMRKIADRGKEITRH